MGSSDSLGELRDVGLPVYVSGSTPVCLTPSAISEFPPETKTMTVVCETGSRHTADWTGVAVARLLEAAGVPAETTHLIVTSTDGYRVAVPVRRGIDALVAYAKDGRPIAADHDYSNRFVSPSLDGTRDVKGVCRIDHRALEPGDDPTSIEERSPDGDRFRAERFAD